MRKRRALIGVAVVVVLAGVGFPMWVQVQWKSALEITDGLRTRIEASDSRRPVIWGTSESGSAWMEYRAAGARVPSLGIARGVVPRTIESEFGDGTAEELEVSAAEYREAGTPLLAILRKGAHREDAAYPMEWDKGFEHPVENLLHTRDLANLAALSALCSMREGRDVEAVHTLLDAMQLGGDLMRGPLIINEMIGCAVLSIPPEALLKTGATAPLMQLSPEALQVLEKGLAILDGSLPLGSQGLAGEIALFTGFLQNGPIESMGSSHLSLWRYGFSMRLAAAEHAHNMARLESRYRELTGRGNSIDLKALETLVGEAENTPNPITKLVLPSVEAMTRARLQTIARLRLLRMAVDHALGRPIRILSDPGGGRLHAEVRESGDVKFGSDLHEILSFTLDARTSKDK